MVAAVTFWLLLSCASALYAVLMCTYRDVSLARLVDGLLLGLGLRKSSPRAPAACPLPATATATAGKSLSGPMGFPLIGALHKLADSNGPFAAFTRLADQYGDIYEIQLGVAKCVVVSSYELIKEVLITKGGHFGGRPDFIRFHHLFGGDRNNSLALCDWSDLQRKRRSIARSFCSPRGGSSQQEEISRVAMDEISLMFQHLDEPGNEPILRGERPVKPVILEAIGNMFTKYMCSTRFGYGDEQFSHVVRIFDEIFWDINQGYAVDFLPWLKPLYGRHLARLSNWADDIRHFILKRIIEPRRASLDLENEIPRDFTDALLYHLESRESELSWQHILFELEDFLGGHSAVGNLVMMVLANAVTYPHIQRKIQQECDALLGRKARAGQELFVLPSDRPELPYTEAVVWETLRVASSPIVPHVATCDTDIDGYPVPKDSVVFLNNYRLNVGEASWGPDAKLFKPERFLRSEPPAAGQAGDGAGAAPSLRVVKPEFFVPFSTGKRTCIGQKLVQGFAFVVVTMLFSKYSISAPPRVDVRSSMQPSCLALPPDCFNLVMTRRKGADGLTN